MEKGCPIMIKISTDFLILTFQFLAFNVLILLKFTLMQEGCRDPLWFYQMVSQFLQPLSPTCLRWHLYYVLKCIGASILYYFYSIPLIYLDVTTPMLSFNHSRFIMHLTPDRICSPLFLFHLKTSLALFTLVSFLHPNCFIGMIPHSAWFGCC